MTHFRKFIEVLRSYSSRQCVEYDRETYTYGELMKEVDRWNDLFCRL